MLNEAPYQIPDTWTWASLDELLETLESGIRPKGGVKKYSEGVPSIGGEHLDGKGGFRFDNIRFVPRDYYQNMKRGKIKNLDILVVKDGATTGKTSIVAPDFPFKEAAVNEHVFILRTRREILEPYYLFRFLSSIQGQNQILQRFQGTAQGGINSKFVEGFPIPLPPLAEQRRIVARVEALLAESKTAREALDKVPVLLRRFRQSVLAKAFRGELTQRDPNDEPAQKLLQKIKQETQTTLIDEEEEQPLNLPKLPEGWIWIKFGNLIESMKNGLYKPLRFYGQGIPCLRMYNIEDGKIVWKNVKEMTLSEKEIEDYSLQENDILLNRVNSRELVGKAAIIPKGIDKVVFESKNIRIKVKQDFVDPRYINYFLLTRYARDQIELECKQTVGMATVSQEDIKSWFIPYTSINEQRCVVSKIEEAFQLSDQIELAVKKARERAERIDQAILAKAFRGELVPQDPNDEPASVLLQRLKTKTKQQTTIQTKLTN
ncbi:MAG: restriction endonuclease subunit S [Candidatus Bathyarchaeia archaeon]